MVDHAAGRTWASATARRKLLPTVISRGSRDRQQAFGHDLPMRRLDHRCNQVIDIVLLSSSKRVRRGLPVSPEVARCTGTLDGPAIGLARLDHRPIRAEFSLAADKVHLVFRSGHEEGFVLTIAVVVR